MRMGAWGDDAQEAPSACSLAPQAARDEALAMQDPVAAAKRRIRYLTPLNAGKVLAHRRYQTKPFVVLYLERIEEAFHEDPEAGFLYALHAQELARRVPDGAPIGYADPSERHAFRLVALGHLAEAAQAVGELAKAQASIAEGTFLLRRDEIPLWARVRFQANKAGYLVDLGQNPKQLITEAMAHIPDDERPQLSVDLAALLFAQARFDLAERKASTAIAEILYLATGHDARAGRLRQRVLADLLHRLRHGAITMASLTPALPMVIWLRKSSRGLERITLFWIEGLINRDLGIDRSAKRRLLWARHYCLKAGCAELADIITDLHAVLRDLGEDMHAGVA